MPVGDAGRRPFILDAMVLAAGLTSRREPASHSRRLVELAFDGAFDLIVTEILLEEAYEVLVDPHFVGRITDAEAGTLIAGLAARAIVVIKDRGREFESLSDDPDDDYLVVAALQAGAYLVTRDEAANFRRVPGLTSGRPGSALRQIGAFGEEGEQS